MVKLINFSIRITINVLAIFMVLCSCCKSQHEQGSLQPEWETAIPTFESDGVYDDGLPNLPKCGNLMVAHTSIYHGGLFDVDNRLCAIDVGTGDAMWYFPSDLNERKYCWFDGNGYLYKDKLLFQYILDDRSSTTRDCRSTACLDANTGAILWKKDGKTNWTPNSMTVVGQNENAYYVQDSMTVIKVNLNNGMFSVFYVNDTLSIGDIYLNDNNIALFCWTESAEDNSKFNTYVVVLDSESGDLILSPFFLYEGYVIPHGIISGGILYATVDGYLMAINIKNKEKLWERNDIWAYTLIDMSVYRDILLKCCGNATVGYNKNTGDILYDYHDYGSWHTSVCGKYAYILSLHDEVDILDIETGEKLDYIKCKYQDNGEYFYGSYPAIYGNKMYIMSYKHLFRYPLYPW